MKKLFIYYSNSGNGDVVAKHLAEKGFEIRKVRPKRELPKKFFFKVLFGGFLAGFNKKAALSGYDASVAEFDEIVIGSPVWNGKVSCPINTVLSKTDLKDKKSAFILYAGGGVAEKAEERLKSLYPSADVIVLKEPKNHPDELKKITL